MSPVPCSYKKLPVDLKPGSQVLIADGSIVLEVISTDPKKGTVRAKCLNSATLGCALRLELACMCLHTENTSWLQHITVQIRCFSMCAACKAFSPDLFDCRERKNMNLPGVVVDLPTLTKKDEVDLVEWGVPNDIDFIAASFVRKGSDIEYIRKVQPGCASAVSPACMSAASAFPVLALH